MECVENYQYVNSNETVLKQRLDLITPEEAYDELERLISYTKILDKDYEGLIYYSQTELEIIGDMAQCLKDLKRYEEGIELILSVVKQFRNSRLDFSSQSSGFDFLFRMLGVLYFRVENYDMCLKIEEYEKAQAVKLRSGSNLAFIMDAIGDALEHKGTEYAEEYRKLYKATYYFADFYNQMHIKKGAQNYYESNFEPDMVWYR